MSVAVPVIDSIDPTARRIYLLTGVRSYHPIDDIYAEVVNLRRTDETLRPFDSFVTALPVFAKGGGTFTPRALICLGGTRIVPADEPHDLEVTGEQLTDTGGAGRDCLDLTLVGNHKIEIHYAPAEAEVIEVNTGSGLTTQQGIMLQEIYARLGLQQGSPVTHTPAAITWDSETIQLTGDGVNSKTASRQ